MWTLYRAGPEPVPPAFTWVFYPLHHQEVHFQLFCDRVLAPHSPVNGYPVPQISTSPHSVSRHYAKHRGQRKTKIQASTQMNHTELTELTQVGSKQSECRGTHLLHPHPEGKLGGRYRVVQSGVVRKWGQSLNCCLKSKRIHLPVSWSHCEASQQSALLGT